MTEVRFPNEPDGYRAAREDLLKAEKELRAKVADVAAQRRRLQLGGVVKQDYIFRTFENGTDKDIQLSDLFATNKDTLLIYSLMYGRKQKSPCALCTSLIDYINGGAQHQADRINFAVCAAAPIADFEDHARGRGWNKVRLLSSSENDYNRDYYAENDAGAQMPMANVFVKQDGIVRHFWGSELLYANVDGHPRHMDQLWPLWNILDLTPEGRGEDWYPQLDY